MVDVESLSVFSIGKKNGGSVVFKIVTELLLLSLLLLCRKRLLSEEVVITAGAEKLKTANANLSMKKGFSH